MSAFDRMRGLFGGGQSLPPPEPVILHPIGFVRSRLRDLRYRDTAGERASIHLFDGYAPALAGLNGFSHALVLTWLDRVTDAQRGTLAERPGGDPSLPEIGVLALRTHHRPNPIGVTVVRVTGLSDARLDVIGLDAIDGTPVLDIKPYLPPYDSVPDATLPGWAIGEEA
ncbi:MAG: tRNA (N6-threonylcarbamoyladenosine(37)-N6)-methyltransferase TrmO [Dehalococcoidia bacterium]